MTSDCWCSSKSRDTSPFSSLKDRKGRKPFGGHVPAGRVGEEVERGLLGEGGEGRVVEPLHSSAPDDDDGWGM